MGFHPVDESFASFQVWDLSFDDVDDDIDADARADRSFCFNSNNDIGSSMSKT